MRKLKVLLTFAFSLNLALAIPGWGMVPVLLGNPPPRTESNIRISAITCAITAVVAVVISLIFPVIVRRLFSDEQRTAMSGWLEKHGWALIVGVFVAFPTLLLFCLVCGGLIILFNFYVLGP